MIADGLLPTMMQGFMSPFSKLCLSLNGTELSPKVGDGEIGKAAYRGGA